MNIPRDIVALDVERGLEEGCRNGLTLDDSDSSGITIDNDDGSEEVSILNANQAHQVEVMEWTDEKHSSYLNYLESSFVKQLHHSLGLRDGRCQENVLGTRQYQEMPVDLPISSDKFMVLRNRCWLKVNFEKKQPLLESTADSRIFLKSPWIRHYTYADKNCTVTYTDPRERSVLIGEVNCERGNATSSSGLERSSEHHPARNPCQEDLGRIITEVSDQNFADENQVEESSIAPKAKRLRTGSSDASDRDQVVTTKCFNS